MLGFNNIATQILKEAFYGILPNTNLFCNSFMLKGDQTDTL